MTPPSITQARLCVVGAAVLWSLSGAFVKLLTRPEVSDLADPPVDPLLIAFYRALFAGLTFLPLVRFRQVSVRPPMLAMMVSFAVMNGLFVSALAFGTAANAIILQYTAPVWMYLGCIFLLGEAADRRSSIALLIAMSGVAVIVIDAWQQQTLGVVLIALGAGVAYAGVLLGLRVLRGYPSYLLTTLNHLFAALVLVPVLFWYPWPTWAQLWTLVVFGTVQMGLPYWLVSRGLRRLSPQEVGTLTLLEPLLNPVWAYLVDPSEIPATSTFIGGSLILAALAWRYWPRRQRVKAEASAA